MTEFKAVPLTDEQHAALFGGWAVYAECGCFGVMRGDLDKPALMRACGDHQEVSGAVTVTSVDRAAGKLTVL